MKRLLFLPLLLIAAVSAWAIPREPVTGPGGIVGPPGISSGVSLALHALTYDTSTYAMTGVLRGIGSMTVARTTTQYCLDSAGVYQAAMANNPCWYGARYDSGTAYADDGAGSLLSPLPSLQIDPSLTNALTYSRDLTNAAWTASDMTTAYTSTGLTGAANTATRLTATDANATVIRAATEVAASATHATRWWIKRVTGTGDIELTLDNGTTWQDITADVDSSFGEGIQVEQAALENPQVGIRLVTSGDAVEVGNAQLHTAKTIAEVRGSGPVFTTDAAVTTGNQTTSFDISNHSDIAGAYYIEITPSWSGIDVLANQRFLFPEHLGYTTAGVDRITNYDGTTGGYSPVGIFVAGTANKYAIVYGNSVKIANVDGTYAAQTAYDGSWGLASGLKVGGSMSQSVLFRNLRIYCNGNYTQLKSAIDGLMP